MQSNKDLNSVIIVNSELKKNKAYGRIHINSALNMPTKITVSNNMDLNCRVVIKPNNKMFGKVDIVEKNVIDNYLLPIKDAFVRSELPVFNYGEQQDLLVGKNKHNNETYRSLLEFNLNSLSRNLIFISAKLTLTCLDYDVLSSDLQLFEANESWFETGVTYNSAPTSKDLIASLSDCGNKGALEFDLSNVIQDWYKGDKIKNGFILKVADETLDGFKRFGSKESQFKPKLVLQYYDPIPKSYGTLIVKSKIVVRKNDYMDLPSKVIVPVHDGGGDFPSQIKVRNGNYINSLITVSRDFITSKITVTGKYDILTQVSIKNDGWNQLPCKIDVSSPFIASKIKITNSIDLNTEIIVKRYDNSIINSKLIVHRPFLNSKIVVGGLSHLPILLKIKRAEGTDVPSQIIVQKYQNNDKNSKLVVTYFKDMPSKIRITGRNDFDSQITIRQNVNRDIKTKIISTHFNDLVTKLRVTGISQEDKDSQIIVKREDYNELNSQLIISYFNDINTLIKVTTASIESQVIVRNYNDNDFDSRIIITPTNNILSKVNIAWTKDIITRMIIKIPYAFDFPSKVEVKDPAVMYSKVIIRHNETFDKDSILNVSKAFVESSLLVNIPFINSKVIISQPSIETSITVHRPFIESKVIISKSFIESKINVSKNNLLCSITIFKPFIDSKIIINRAFIDTILKVREHTDSDIESKLVVIEQGIKDIQTKINISVQNKMFGRVEIERPPNIKVEKFAIQDAYVKKSVPMFNYGDMQDMYIGSNNYGNEIYRSLLSFTLKDIPKTAYFTKCKLVLTACSLEYYPHDIELHETSKAWYEYGVTYAGQPNSLGILAKVESSNTLVRKLEFDLLSYADGWYNGISIKNGFILKSSEENTSVIKRFFTRESLYPPILEIEYFDTAVINRVNANINSLVTVRQSSYKDLNSKITIPVYDFYEDLSSKLTIRNRGNMASDIDSTIRISKGDMKSSIKVRNYDENWINSKLLVRNYADDDGLLSSVNISQPKLDCKIIVYRNDSFEIDTKLITRRIDNIDLDSVINVKKYSVKDINTKIGINKDWLDSKIVIREHSSIDCRIEINKKSNVDLQSKIVVNYTNDINSKLLVTQISDIKNKIIIQRNEYKDIDSKIKITNVHDISTRIDVSYSKDINSKIKVRLIGDIDLPVKITVINISDLDTKIQVVKGDINSRLVVRINETIDLDSNIIVLPTSNILSRVDIVQVKDINSSITVRSSFYSDMLFQITIKNYGVIGYAYIM